MSYRVSDVTFPLIRKPPLSRRGHVGKKYNILPASLTLLLQALDENASIDGQKQRISSTEIT
jgi:hypothetical protein